MSAVVVRGLSKAFGRVNVLNNIDLSVEPGQNVVILGGSGSGKSVFVKCLIGLLKPDAGAVTIDGLPMNAANKPALVKKIGMAFQGGALFDSITVLANVAFGLIYGDGYAKAAAEAAAMEALRAVGLDENAAARYPAELSGGMQKRVALARATVRSPALFVFDEPTAGLDPVMAGVINRLIRATVRRTGAAALTITHDLSTLHEVGDRAVFLQDGNFVWQGTPASTHDEPESPVGKFVRGVA